MSSRGRRSSCVPSDGVPELPPECLDAIVERLPPNCIPLAIRQLNKERRQRYLQHTAVQAGGDSYLSAWAAVAALPHLHNNFQKPQLLPALARRGDLEGMRLLVNQAPQQERRYLFVSDFALCAAAAAGRLEIVRWLVEEQGCRDIYCRMLDSAAFGGHQHVLQWMRADGCELKRNAYAAAARGGHIGTIKWLLDNGCDARRPWNLQPCAEAAAGGQLQMLQWLTTHGWLYDPGAMATAAKHGHLHVVEWLRNDGCAWSQFTCWNAAHGGHLDVLQYSIEHGCPVGGADLCGLAAQNGHRHILVWLRENGHPWTASACKSAAANCDLALLRWLREQTPPCPWDSRVYLQITYSIHQERQVECLEYALSTGCPWNSHVYREVLRNSRLRHVKWPGVRRSKRVHKK